MNMQPDPNDQRFTDRVAVQRAARIENLAAIEEIVRALSVAERRITELTAEHNAARNQIEQITETNLRAYRLVCAERDAARQDAERMAHKFKQAAMLIHEWNYHGGEFSECTRQICDENCHALAAHAAATKKPVTK